MCDYGSDHHPPSHFISEEEIREFAKMYGFARITCGCPGRTKLDAQAHKRSSEEVEKTLPKRQRESRLGILALRLSKSFEE